MNAAEQETTVTGTRGDAIVYIYSAVGRHVRKMERDDRFTRREGDGATWGNYTISSDAFDPLSGLKRKRAPMTDEQRADLVERGKRLAALRKG